MISNAAMWWWGGVAMAVIAACGVVWAVGSDWWATRKLRKAGALRRCRKCLFDMSGLTTLACPECGRKAKSERSLRSVRRRWGMAAMCVLMLMASWVVSEWPRLRDGWRPKWYMLATIPFEQVSDPWKDQLGTQTCVWHWWVSTYYDGEISAFDEGVLINARRVAAIVSRHRARDKGRGYVETQIDLRRLVPDSMWQVEEFPRFDRQRPKSPISNPGVGMYPEDKLDWTLAKWNRRRQFECYEELCDGIMNVGEPSSVTDARYEIDLSSRQFVRWGDPEVLPLVLGAATELEHLINDDEAGTSVGPVRYSQGVRLGEQMVRVYKWTYGEAAMLGDDFEKQVVEVVQREELLASNNSPSEEIDNELEPYGKPRAEDRCKVFNRWKERKGILIRASVKKQDEILRLLTELVERSRTTSGR